MSARRQPEEQSSDEEDSEDEEEEEEEEEEFLSGEDFIDDDRLSRAAESLLGDQDGAHRPAKKSDPTTKKNAMNIRYQRSTLVLKATELKEVLKKKETASALQRHRPNHGLPSHVLALVDKVARLPGGVKRLMNRMLFLAPAKNTTGYNEAMALHEANSAKTVKLQRAFWESAGEALTRREASEPSDSDKEGAAKKKRESVNWTKLTPQGLPAVGLGTQKKGSGSSEGGGSRASGGRGSAGSHDRIGPGQQNSRSISNATSGTELTKRSGQSGGVGPGGVGVEQSGVKHHRYQLFSDRLKPGITYLQFVCRLSKDLGLQTQHAETLFWEVMNPRYIYDEEVLFWLHPQNHLKRGKPEVIRREGNYDYEA